MGQKFDVFPENFAQIEQKTFENRCWWWPEMTKTKCWCGSGKVGVAVEKLLWQRPHRPYGILHPWFQWCNLYHVQNRQKLRLKFLTSWYCTLNETIWWSKMDGMTWTLPCRLIPCSSPTYVPGLLNFKKVRLWKYFLQNKIFFFWNCRDQKLKILKNLRKPPCREFDFLHFVRFHMLFASILSNLQRIKVSSIFYLKLRDMTPLKRHFQDIYPTKKSSRNTCNTYSMTHWKVSMNVTWDIFST